MKVVTVDRSARQTNYNRVLPLVLANADWLPNLAETIVGGPKENL